MFIYIIILGIIQGICEFLPVSSSGHLALFQRVIPDLAAIPEKINLLIDVSLHIATLLAVLLFLRKRIIKLIKDRDINYFGLIIISSIPTAIIGLILEHPVERATQNKYLLTVFFIITAIILFASRFSRYTDKKILWQTALIIGIVQGLAVIPGISRSGITITTAMLLGIKNKEAGDFSFLISVPAIFGAALLESRHINPGILGQYGIPVLLGMIAAFISGYFSLKILYRILEKRVWYKFAYYMIIIALINLFI